MGTDVFDPASWDEAAGKIEALRTTVNNRVRLVVQRTPLDFVSASPVDRAVHKAGIYPRNNEIAALLITVGKRMADEATAARARRPRTTAPPTGTPPSGPRRSVD